MKKMYMKCPYCLANVSEKNYKSHINRVHRKEVKRHEAGKKEKEIHKKILNFITEKVEERVEGRNPRDEEELKQIMEEEKEFLNRILET
jgi:uncharacterized C2H2 Zn-finger protein